ncbi:hypothetical protein P7C71_g1276, partial [Lecanoromycetidae sp. Uapishka_2]
MSSSAKQPAEPKKGEAPSQSASNIEIKPAKDAKKKDSHLRPSTPPAQMGSRLQVDDGNSPGSQACGSGAVTPKEAERLRKEHQSRDPRP